VWPERLLLSKGVGCADHPKALGRNFVNEWASVRNPSSAAEPLSVEVDYNTAMTLYCDMANGKALQESYDWDALLKAVPDIENVT